MLKFVVLSIHSPTQNNAELWETTERANNHQRTIHWIAGLRDCHTTLSIPGWTKELLRWPIAARQTLVCGMPGMNISRIPDIVVVGKPRRSMSKAPWSNWHIPEKTYFSIYGEQFQGCEIMQDQHPFEQPKTWLLHASHLCLNRVVGLEEFLASKEQVGNHLPIHTRMKHTSK